MYNMDNMLAGERPPAMNTKRELTGEPPMPDEWADLAGQVDDKEAALLQGMSPVGDFHSPALNRVVSALNAVLVLFSVPPVDSFTEDASSFPVPLMKMLLMVQRAAKDAEVMELDFKRIKYDGDLTLFAGKLTALAKDRDFKAFLAAPAKPVKPAVKEQPAAEPSDADMETLFASRS